MEDKEILRSSKRNRNVRNILLSSIIVLFITFVVVFLFSFIQYKSIQNRIQSIYVAINGDKNDFSELLNLFNEAENSFRNFSISYNKQDYDTYRDRLTRLKSAVDSLIKTKDFITLGNSESPTSTRVADLLPKYHSLNAKVDSMLSASELLKDIQAKASDDSMFRIPKQNTIADTDRFQLQSERNTQMVIKRKPLLQRIFQKKEDTVSVNGYDTYNVEKTEIFKTLEEIISENNLQTAEKLKELRTTMSKLRKNERALLADNFTLLHSANQLIRMIHDERIDIQRGNTDRELSTLIASTDTFRWQIIVSLTFVFIIICILVYYQFFSAYYERKLMEEKVYASKLAEQKTDILAEITHEIRTPLNSLIGIVDLLKSRKDLYQPKDISLLESAYSNITMTSKTINDILNLSKIDQHDSIDPTHFDYNDLLLEVIEGHQHQAKLKNIGLDYQINRDVPSIIYTDEVKVRQILNNLVSNAIKYSSKGTVTSSMRVNEKGHLIIQVSDQGEGIPDNLKKNIFKKYYTVNKSNKIDSGVGLGLYITKNIVNMLDGKIGFRTTTGSGTTFIVDIPIPQPKYRRKNTINVHRVNELSTDLGWLIVDDNALNLLYLRQFFSLHNKVFTATNGKEALTILEQEKIDVVVTDINMPIMTGDELLEKIRQNAEWDQVKIIATSSDNEQVKNLEKLRKVRFDGILIKPFNEKKLTEIILKTLYPIFEDSGEKL
ncbi:ATP-binding protein [Sphingobacterium lactis]|uniref:ATP-binding protein n=1 Tax=Sphingobacterium lactis TaxID=797291 RepID=UPI003F8014DA